MLVRTTVLKAAACGGGLNATPILYAFKSKVDPKKLPKEAGFLKKMYDQMPEDLDSLDPEKVFRSNVEGANMELHKKQKQIEDDIASEKKHHQRASDEEREGLELPRDRTISEEERWYPKEDPNRLEGKLGIAPGNYDKTMKTTDGMHVPRVSNVPNPNTAIEVTDSFLGAKNYDAAADSFDEQKRALSPPTFDPAIDDLDIEDYVDVSVITDTVRAGNHDKDMLDKLANPITVEDQLDALMRPQRDQDISRKQRSEFNGLEQLCLISGANYAAEEMNDLKKASEFVNRYLRDIDLLEKWWKHPKVQAHFAKKFGSKFKANRFDKLMAFASAFHTRAKIQAMESDLPGALKSATAGIMMIREGSDLEHPSHRKMLGGLLGARGGIYTKLKSWQRAEDDFNGAEDLLDVSRAPTLFQLRAVCREALGKVDEAREDEERAADIYENADTVYPGLGGEATKFLI